MTAPVTAAYARETRKILGLTQAELAKRIGVRTMTISDREQEGRVIRGDAAALYRMMRMEWESCGKGMVPKG